MALERIQATHAMQRSAAAPMHTKPPPTAALPCFWHLSPPSNIAGITRVRRVWQQTLKASVHSTPQQGMGLAVPLGLNALGWAGFWHRQQPGSFPF